MSHGTFSDDEELMSEINMVPLVDVMLVLLIIFMITVPVIHHAVKLDLPRATNQTSDQRPPHINLTIRVDGSILWNGRPLAPEQLRPKLTAMAAQRPQPELHLYAERQTPYERVAQALSSAQSTGIAKIGFITTPQK